MNLHLQTNLFFARESHPPFALEGELASRTIKNLARLEDPFFRPDNLFGEETRNHAWPGDWEGRALLAWVLLARSTGRKSGYLREFMIRLYADQNSAGYLGPILPEGHFDEQQMAGHSWLLRGLVEYSRDHEDAQADAMIHAIVHRLYMPLSGRLSHYPLDRSRSTKGEAAGVLSGTCISGYDLSTDTGCLFISLDGLTAAYERKSEHDLEVLIREMIRRFQEMDLLEIQAQTHASLTAARGILRFYRTTGESEYLQLAQRVFDIYRQYGMSENYANYNWFGRPEWTEPCAIVDSYLLAVQLWQCTGDKNYLATAHAIWLNAVGFAQRENGGFGCDNCAGAQDVFVNVKSRDLYEAYWCCSMRGGEGLYAAASYSLFSSDTADVFAFYNSGLFTEDEGSVWDVRSQYPLSGNVEMVYHTQHTSKSKEILFYLPDYAEEAHIEIDGVAGRYRPETDGFIHLVVTLREGTTIRLSFDIPLCIEKTRNPFTIHGYETIRHGYLLLGHVTQEAYEIKLDQTLLRPLSPGWYTDGQYTLQPINDVYLIEKEKSISEKRQILFSAE